MAKYDYIKLANKVGWSEKELNAFKNFISKGTDSSRDALEAFYDNPLIEDADGIALSSDQVKKGFKYLKNLGFTPTGKKRSNSPFGYREEHIVKNPYSIEIIDFYQPSFFSSFRVPVYQATGGPRGDRESMDYYVSGGQISIIG